MHHAIILAKQRKKVKENFHKKKKLKKIKWTGAVAGISFSE